MHYRLCLVTRVLLVLIFSLSCDITLQSDSSHDENVTLHGHELSGLQNDTEIKTENRSKSDGLTSSMEITKTANASSNLIVHTENSTTTFTPSETTEASKGITDENAFKQSNLTSSNVNSSNVEDIPKDKIIKTLPNVTYNYLKPDVERHKPSVARKGVSMNRAENTTDDGKDCVCCSNVTVSEMCSCQCIEENNKKPEQTDGNREIIGIFSEISTVTTTTTNKETIKNVKDKYSYNATVTEIIGETTTSKKILVSENSDILSAVAPHKYKPAYTRDDNSSDVVLISEISPPTNYIIPLVAIILAAPLFIVLFLFIYKRGTEVWERRHYRRMDFLIDGMYND